MLTINTNLSSLITQRSMKQSTNKLNIAIERMTTGFKINHAKDNAANFGIVTNMTTQIGSLDVAEDNTSMALDLLTTASDNLSLIQDRVQRLRALQEQASNGTYGEQSLQAINAECNSLVDEINRLYLTTEYNGIQLFIDTEEDENGKSYYEQESFADESSTFKELEIGASSFAIYSQDGTLEQSYDTEETDTIGDFLSVLRGEGFEASINTGKIIISSTNDKYIGGDLVDLLGISTKETSFVESTEQNFNNQIPVTTESTTVITELTTTTTSTTNTTTLYETTMVDKTTTRTETTTSITSTETVITETTTTTIADTQTTTIYETTTVATTTTTPTETVTTTYTTETETLLVQTEEEGGNYFITNPITYTDAQVAAMTTMTQAVANSLLASGGTYSISTTEELVALADYVNAENDTSGMTFVLGADIDLSSIANWTPIGDCSTNSKSFCGTFDGNGHVIKNLTIDNETESFQGLFGGTRGNIGNYSTLQNVGLVGINVTGSFYVGGLVGHAAYTYIYNSYATGDVTGSYDVGGLVGQDYFCDISNCHATCDVTGGSDVGGLVGMSYGSIMDSYATGDVTGSYYVGGLVGSAEGTYDNSYATGTVSGDVTDSYYVGGLVGYAEGAYIDNSYATGTVSGDCVGGLVGRSEISYCYNSYSTGSVTGSPSSDSVTNSSDWDGTYFTYDYATYPGNSAPTYIPATLDTTLAELGVSGNTTIALPNTTVTMASTKTLEEFIEEIKKDSSVTNAELIDGVLLITTVNAALNLSTGFLSEHNSTQSSNTTTSTVDVTTTIGVEKVNTIPVTETIYTTTTTETTRTETITTTQTIEQTITETIQVEQVTTTPVTETVWTTTTTETTRTETLQTTTTIQITGSTKLSDLSPYASLKVTVNSDGTKNIVTLESDTTFDDFYSRLQDLGISTSVSGNTITFTGQGNSYIDSKNLKDILGLSSVSRTMGSKTSNTDSERLYAKERVYGVYAPGQVHLQVGTVADSNSQIEIDVSFTLRGIDGLREIGQDLDTDYLSIIDSMLSEINSTQTKFGAASNRLVSALDEITIRRENLISSRSTLRDADIAEVSSEYIKQQILQQASATLMSTANQSPAIALQLI